jgi:hypothetical protein
LILLIFAVLFIQLIFATLFIQLIFAALFIQLIFAVLFDPANLFPPFSSSSCVPPFSFVAGLLIQLIYPELSVNGWGEAAPTRYESRQNKTESFYILGYLLEVTIKIWQSRNSFFFFFQNLANLSHFSHAKSFV